MMKDAVTLLVGIACCLAIMHVAPAAELDPGWAGTEAHLRATTRAADGSMHLTTAHVVIDEVGQPRIEWACYAGRRPPCPLDDYMVQLANELGRPEVYETPRVTVADGPGESCTVELRFNWLFGGYTLLGHVTGCDWPRHSAMDMDGAMDDGGTIQARVRAH